MNITVEHILLFFIGIALYLLMNRCECTEGMKNSGDPKNNSDCDRLCSERRVGLDIGQQCVFDKNCENGGIGCKIGGITLCRLCDNDETTDYSPCVDYSPPPPPPTPPPPPPPPPPKEIHGRVVDNITMFDISILDLDPKKHGWIIYEHTNYNQWMTRTKKQQRDVLVTNPEKLTLLQALQEYVGIDYIRVESKFFTMFYDWNIHFHGSGNIRFWDDTGDMYSIRAIRGGHDLSYDSDRPKLTALYSNNACIKTTWVRGESCHPP